MRRATALMVLWLGAACASGPRPNAVGAQRALARELINRRDWPRAFEVADGLCRSAPKHAESWLLRGLVYREQKLEAEAEADLNEALRIDGDLAEAHAALGILYDGQRRGDDALRHHKRAVELEPRNPSYLNNLGFSLFAHGRPREALPVLHEALRAAPTDARLRNNLGFAYAAAGDFTHAAAQFALGGTPAQAKNNLGWAYERRGSLTQAHDLYVEALRLDEGSAVVRENVARTERALRRQPGENPPPRDG
jgi:Flp pilus assembly protein TadD